MDGPDPKWTVFWPKVDGLGESGRSFGPKWTVLGPKWTVLGPKVDGPRGLKWTVLKGLKWTVLCGRRGPKWTVLGVQSGRS